MCGEYDLKFLTYQIVVAFICLSRLLTFLQGFHIAPTVLGSLHLLRSRIAVLFLPFAKLQHTALLGNTVFNVAVLNVIVC